jgi:hypothetical protein
MDSRSVDIGIVSDPGLAEDVGAAVAGRLAEVMQQRVRGEVDWRVHHRSHPLATGAQTQLADIAAAEVPVEPTWDITVLLTDLPRREGTDPVEIETSADHRVVVVSLPALGALRLNRRAEQVIASAVAELLDPGSPARQHPVSSRFRPRLRLLVGMVRANRPWLLFSGLSRSLAGVFGTAALVLLDNVGWQLGVSLGPGRLGGIAVLSSLALTAWLIVDHELWERPSDAQAKQLARLYNTTTAVTLMIGIGCLYLGLFIVLTIVSVIVLEPQVLQTTLVHTPTWADRLGIVWFATSAAMIGGALGSGLEHDDVVRQAAYGERQRRRGESYEHRDDQVR